MYYTYILKDDNNPFYVGKGTKDRMYHHKRKAKATKIKLPVLDKIRKMVKNNKEIIYEKVLISENEQEIIDKEVELIKKIGRRDLGTGPLLNLTDGGEGVIGYVWTESHKKNLSKAVKKAIKEGRFKPNGAKFERDSNYKEKMSKAIKDYYKNNPQAKKRVSKQRKALLVNGKRVLSDEARKKMGSSGKNRVWTEEMKKKHSIALKKAWRKRKCSTSKR